MRVFSTRLFDKWAAREGIGAAAISPAVAEMVQGLVDADLVRGKLIEVTNHG